MKRPFTCPMTCRYNPENTQHVIDGDKKKRVAVKKEKAEQKKDEDKKKRGDDGQTEESNEDVGEFLNEPVMVKPLSESDMGRHVIYSGDGKELIICI